MTTDLAIALTSHMLWGAFSIAMPILAVALVVGLFVSLIQVVTQIQEMTLTFVPKILAVGATVLILGHWMLTTLVNYATGVISGIPAYF